MKDFVPCDNAAHVHQEYQRIPKDDTIYMYGMKRNDENRIEAAISVLTLLLVYFAVCIIVHRIIPRWIQIHNTPRRFAIVECSDCSITIEWYVHDQDDSLKYDLDYRNKETDKWTVATLSTRDVLTEENGRRVYTLINILPETGYELKLCSVDNNVKSHHTESKTILTPKRGNEIFKFTEY
ncbi:Hypothetical predicted protein [Mytilus galloprovincialis]|uniref:Fibronectin type-III domain-containing protein n=1 Tax=Mytilus galloprovincialis TaxID=29158 RepID=A0A8B6EVV7_MYTGA|nr:Hypothetical predicted protein [Mytilus galloprovincialis]